jgi:peptidoglycan/xylan/chitin deacetylase (PgdA/CDA1 family)
MQPKPIAHLIFSLLMLSCACSVWLPGCGDPAQDVPDESVSGYLLDPPELSPGAFPPAQDGVPVFCYHYFRSGFDPAYLMKVLGSVVFGMPALGPREFWTTPVGEFEKHLRYFRDTGTVVMTLDEVADLVEAGHTLPDRAVVLTIDDADRSVYELAWPLLRKYGMKAHLFVPTAKVGQTWGELEVCGWGELTEMANSGHIIVESHTHDLHFKVREAGNIEPVFLHPGRVPGEALSQNLNDLARRVREDEREGIPSNLNEVLSNPYAAVGVDLVISRVDLKTLAGARADWLAWPYGFATDELDSLSREIGFRGTVSLLPRAFTVRDSSLQVGRFALTAKSTLAHIGGVFPR